MSDVGLEADAKIGPLDRVLSFIERVGNKVPHPAVLFLGLCVGLIVLSQILAWVGWSATYEVVKPPPSVVEEIDVGGSMLPVELLPTEQADAGTYEVVTETSEINGLLSADGIRFLFTSFVGNFMAFTAMGIILIVMIGVGVSELSGLIASLIRKLVAASSPGTLMYIIVGLGVVSSIASDAGYLVLIPLGAAAFHSVGRNPLAGMAAAFAGVAGGFGVNLLITPTDAVLTEITNEAIGLVEPGRTIDITANLYFSIGSTIVLTILLAIVSQRIVEPRLGVYDPATAPTGDELRDQPDTFEGLTPEHDSRGLRWAGTSFVAALAAILLLTLPSGAPLRDPETGDIIGTSPFMDSLIVIIALLFLAAGLGYGRGAGTLTTSTDAINAVTKSWAGMAGLLFLFLLIAQFIAYFNYSNIPQIAAVKLGDLLEEWNIGTLGLLLMAIVITIVVGIIMPQAIAKWALLAPIFVPLFLRLGVDPEVVLAAYRVADSPINIVTPIMAYFPLIVVFALRYDKNAGIGTVIALMLPYFVALTVVWTAFFAGWYLLDIPWGP
ncbi:MAG: AbgT family transporter [Ilumatobacter sp.]|nr:AbgT family transporter [Ilumatobacter sp.]